MPERGSSHKSPLLLAQTGPHKSNVRNKPEPLPDEVLELYRKRARRNDMIYAAWIRRAGEFHPSAYQAIDEENPHCQKIEYANARNWAGNLFEKEAVSEDLHLHIPLDGDTRSTRVVPSFHTIPENPRGYLAAMYDMGKPGFRMLLADAIVEAIQAGANGIWVDNAGIRPKFFQCRAVKDGPGARKQTPLNPRTGKRYTVSEQWAEYLAMSGTIAATVNQAFPDWMAHGRKIILVPNIGHDIIPAEWDLVSNYRGCLSEGRSWFDGKNEPPTPEQWVQSVQWAQEVVRRGLVFMYKGSKWRGDAGDWPSRSRLLFSYATALLCGGRSRDNLYYSYNHGALNAWPGFDVELGWAIGDAFKWKETSWVHGRRYQNGLVIVNPGTQKAELEPVLEGDHYRFLDDESVNRIKWNGMSEPFSPGSSVVVRPHTGAILMGTFGLQPGEAPPDDDEPDEPVEPDEPDLPGDRFRVAVEQVLEDMRDDKDELAQRILELERVIGE